MVATPRVAGRATTPAVTAAAGTTDLDTTRLATVVARAGVIVTTGAVRPAIVVTVPDAVTSAAASIAPPAATGVRAVIRVNAVAGTSAVATGEATTAARVGIAATAAVLVVSGRAGTVVDRIVAVAARSSDVVGKAASFRVRVTEERSRSGARPGPTSRNCPRTSSPASSILRSAAIC